MTATTQDDPLMLLYLDVIADATNHGATARAMAMIDRAWLTSHASIVAEAKAKARAEWEAVEASGDVFAMTEWLDRNRARLDNETHGAACARICRRGPVIHRAMVRRFDAAMGDYWDCDDERQGSLLAAAHLANEQASIFSDTLTEAPQ